MNEPTTKAAFKPVIIKRITVPKMRLIADVPVYVKITDKITKEVFNVTNIETGEVCRLIAGSIVRKELEDNYPKDKYVNKCFMIVKGKKKGTGTRSYYTHEISEITEPKAT